MESLGAISCSAVSLLSGLGWRTAEVSGETRDGSFLWNRGTEDTKNKAPKAARPKGVENQRGYGTFPLLTCEKSEAYLNPCFKTKSPI